MDQKADKIHVTPLGDHWDVEAESGKTLAQEEDKREVKTAEILAQEQGVESIILHEGDGTFAEIAAPSSQTMRGFTRTTRLGFDLNWPKIGPWKS
jgi:hypothetical protein